MCVYACMYRNVSEHLQAFTCVHTYMSYIHFWYTYLIHLNLLSKEMCMYKFNPRIVHEETSTATRSTGDRLALPWLTEQKSHMSPYGCMCVQVSV